MTQWFFIKCNRLAQHDRSEIIASVFLAQGHWAPLRMCKQKCFLWDFTIKPEVSLVCTFLCIYMDLGLPR